MARVGVLTAGGEAPGMNAAVKAVAYRAVELGIEPVGIFDGWEGLLGDDPPETIALDPPFVRHWDGDGGSHLGCSRLNPFRIPHGSGFRDAASEVAANAVRLELDAIVLVGGHDAIGVAARLRGWNVPIVAVPTGIDNAIAVTEHTLGFDSMVNACASLIHLSRTPAGTQGWVQVVEVPGRDAGHLALWSGVAGGAQTILIPEVPFQLERLYALIEDGLNRPRYKGLRTPRYATVVVAEGARVEGGHMVRVDAAPDAFGNARLGGIGQLLAERIRQDTRFDGRATAVGHPARGSHPSAMDRVLAFRFGSAAADAVARRNFGTLLCASGSVFDGKVSAVPLDEAAGSRRPLDVSALYDSARYFAARR